jgi:hypothetical protein
VQQLENEIRKRRQQLSRFSEINPATPWTPENRADKATNITRGETEANNMRNPPRTLRFKISSL